MKRNVYQVTVEIEACFEGFVCKYHYIYAYHIAASDEEAAKEIGKRMASGNAKDEHAWELRNGYMISAKVREVIKDVII